MSLHHGPQQSKQLPGIALTKDRIDRAGQLRKPLLTLHHRHLRQHRLHPCHLNLHPWVPLHSNWRNRFDSFKLSNSGSWILNEHKNNVNSFPSKMDLHRILYHRHHHLQLHHH